MSPTPPPTLNPSQAVERIREIIVGRHLEKLEVRVARLEATGPASHVPPPWEDRLCLNEAKLEALQHGLQRLADSTREETESRAARQREEIQRLSAQIQQTAAAKTAESAGPAVQQLEQKIGSWLNHWQGALQTHLTEREERVSQQLRGEVAALWENTESQITRMQSRMVDRDSIEERFRRIAEAARALAECACPSPPSPASSGPSAATP
jgi:hypothetical protein